MTSERSHSIVKNEKRRWTRQAKSKNIVSKVNLCEVGIVHLWFVRLRITPEECLSHTIHIFISSYSVTFSC